MSLPFLTRFTTRAHSFPYPASTTGTKQRHNRKKVSITSLLKMEILKYRQSTEHSMPPRVRRSLYPQTLVNIQYARLIKHSSLKHGPKRHYISTRAEKTFLTPSTKTTYVQTIP